MASTGRNWSDRTMLMRTGMAHYAF